MCLFEWFAWRCLLAAILWGHQSSSPLLMRVIMGPEGIQGCTTCWALWWARFRYCWQARILFILSGCISSSQLCWYDGWSDVMSTVVYMKAYSPGFLMSDASKFHTCSNRFGFMWGILMKKKIRGYFDLSWSRRSNRIKWPIFVSTIP